MAFRLTRILSTSLLVFVSLTSSTRCGRQSAANDPPRFPFAHVQEGCGPADGPALQFYFTVKPAKCGKYEEPFLLIQLIGNSPKAAPNDYIIGSSSRDMLASRCQSPGHCEAATSGVLPRRINEIANQNLTTNQKVGSSSLSGRTIPSYPFSFTANRSTLHEPNLNLQAC